MPQSFADQLRSIPMSPNLGQSLERAHRSARDQSHRLVTLEHLLLALAEDAEAALILQSANVDLGRLGTDVSGYLGRLLDDMRAEPGAEPRPDPELLRVLQAAASAAQQSRRKQIDGAIVLAAIVGDGKSPAAGMLKALGMTFEEAIRALQRANTKARLKPLAKPSPVPAAEAPTVAARVDAGFPPVEAELPATSGLTAEDQPPGAQHLVAQSADDILAAARARIQQRAATKAARTEPSVVREAPPVPPQEAGLPYPAAMDIDPELEPVDPAQTKSLTAAIEAAMASSGSRGSELVLPSRAPSSPAAASPAPDGSSDKTVPTSAALPQTTPAARPAWTPSPEPQRKQAGRVPQPPLARAPPPPFPVRSVQPNEGPRRPPLPPRQAANGHAQPGIPNRPARAPWPEVGEPGAVARPALANGSLAGTAATGARPPPWPGPAPRGGQSERALLAESVPRRMRVGVPAMAEVRVARDKVDALIAALNGRGPPHQGDASIARALSVRLGATEGRFWIEPASPETHWVDSSPAAPRDEPLIWRWTVVPRRRGRSRLTLMVSAQGVSRDGVAAQSAPTDRTVEVRVRPNHLRRAARLAGWIAAMALGAFIAHRGQEYWVPVLVALKKALAILGV
jgi:neural Wiskott-Aldrich syndrome protein